MFKYLVVLLVTAALIVQSESRKSNNRNSYGSAGNHTRVVGGRPISINKAPWQVALMYNNHFSCGGSIVRNDLILTAAHCVFGDNLKNFMVRAGSNKYNSGGQTSKLQKIIIDSGYRSATNVNDVALLKLKTPFEFNESVGPVKLATDYQPQSRTAAVTGWGSTREGGASSPVLRSVLVQFIPLRQCQSDYKKLNQIHSTMVCAGHIDGGRDACQGDSGGPLTSKGTLYGIVSFGEGCGRARYPGVYTSVARKGDWIRRAMNAI